jgi:prefoldin subunit 5
LKKDSSKQHEVISTLQEDKSMLERQLENFERHSNTLQASISRAEYRENELESLKEEVRHCREKERELLVTIEKNKGELIRLEDRE